MVLFSLIRGKHLTHLFIQYFRYRVIMQDKSHKNRYLRLSRPQQLIIILLICGVAFIAIECLSWLGLYSIWRISGKEIIQVEFIREFQPFSRKNIFVTRSEYKPYYLSGLIPNMKISRRTPYGTDRHGLLVNNTSQYDRDLRIRSNAYRIFLFGNSTAMGSGSERSLAAYLENALNSDAKNTNYKHEVITAGGDGFNSGQQLARLSMETLHYHPDMIITFDGVADAFWSSFSNDKTPNAQMLAKSIKTSLRQNSLDSKSVIEINISSVDFFFRRFYSYNIMLAIFAKIGVNITDPFNINDQLLFQDNLVKIPAFRPEGVKVYLENHKSIAAITDVRKIKTLHFLQPTLATELIRRGEEASDTEWDLLETQNLKRNYSRSHRAHIFNQFYDGVRLEFRRQALSTDYKFQTWIDLSNFFNNTEDLTDVYYDAVHYNDHQAKELADHMAMHVRRVLENTKYGAKAIHH